MKKFINRYNNKIVGILSTFDRMIFKGHILPFFYKNGRHYFLYKAKILLKDFWIYAKEISRKIKINAQRIASKQGRPYTYIDSSNVKLEKIAEKIKEKDKIEEGLICVISRVEPCISFDVRLNKETNKLELVTRERKCTFFYFYYQHTEFGFMHIRVQSWFPFQIQIYINGREWLSKQLDKEKISYQRYDNTFIKVDDIKRAQKIAKKLTRLKFAKIFSSLSRPLNPFISRIREVFPKGYYWVLDQGEYATDVMFKDRKSLLEIYPQLVEDALISFRPRDVMIFLGRKLSARFSGEVITEKKERPEGVRIKHRMKKNSIKMYDKWNVLRIETTINNPREFKIYRWVTRSDGEMLQRWVPMGKSVFNLYRYAEVSQKANERYLEALASFVPLHECIKQIEEFSQARYEGKNRYSGFNPVKTESTKLFELVLDGGNIINGFRNKDLQGQLYKEPLENEEEKKKQSSKVTRIIKKLRVHGIIAKIPRSRRYKVTEKGYRILGGAIKLKKRDFPLEMLKAA